MVCLRSPCLFRKHMVLFTHVVFDSAPVRGLLLHATGHANLCVKHLTRGMCMRERMAWLYLQLVWTQCVCAVLSSAGAFASPSQLHAVCYAWAPWGACASEVCNDA